MVDKAKEENVDFFLIVENTCETLCPDNHFVICECLKQILAPVQADKSYVP